MRYRAKVISNVEMTVWINENLNGDTEIEEVEEVTETIEYEIKSKIK